MNMSKDRENDVSLRCETKEQIVRAMQDALSYINERSQVSEKGRPIGNKLARALELLNGAEHKEYNPLKFYLHGQWWIPENNNE